MKSCLETVLVFLLLAEVLQSPACTQAAGESAVSPAPVAAAILPMRTSGAPARSFALRSPAFGNGGQIPSQYTCGGSDQSPALAWNGVPAAARSLALIADDPDAPRGTWSHWLLWNLPARVTELPGGVPAREQLETGARQGTNDFGRLGYGGPCPPPGRPHRYYFHLFALNAALNLNPGAGRGQLERAMKGHVVAEAHWMGTYGR